MIKNGQQKKILIVKYKNLSAAYAADFIIAGSAKWPENNLNTGKETWGKYGMRININKTKLMKREPETF